MCSAPKPLRTGNETTSTTTEQILQICRQRAEEPLNAEAIAMLVPGVAPGVIRVVLNRLYRKGHLDLVRRGWYKAPVQPRATVKDLSERVGSGEVQVHWLRLIGDPPRDATCNIVYPIPETTQPGPGQMQLHQWEEEGNRAVLKTAWRGRAVRFYRTPYSIEVQLACSEAPVSVPELDSYLSFLEGWFLSEGWDFWSIDWRATNFALNVDTTTIRLDGVESVTLQSLKGEVRRWYTKHGITGEPVRREIHVAGPGVPVRALVQELVANLAGERPVGTTTLAHEVMALLETQKDQGKEIRRLRSLGDRLLLELRRLRPEGATVQWGRTVPPQRARHRRAGGT